MDEKGRKNIGMLIFGLLYFVYVTCLVLFVDKIYYAYVSIPSVYLSVFIWELFCGSGLREEKRSVLYIVANSCAILAIFGVIIAITLYVLALNSFRVALLVASALNGVSLCLYALERSAFTLPRDRVWLKISFLLTILLPVVSLLGGRL